MLPQITMTGRLTADPELRFTQSGAPVASFTVATNDRVKRGDQWEDGPSCFLDCTAWRGLAESVAEQLRKGMLVTVTGKLEQQSWQAQDGSKRSKHAVQVDEVGVTVTRAKVAGQGDRRDWTSEDPFPAQQAAQADPWGAPAASDEAPF